jgi:Regulator of chromosome condensation (RCC1) repeat
MTTTETNSIIAAWIGAVAVGALLTGCSSVDLSCAETATCPPIVIDDASPDLIRDSSGGGADANALDGSSASDGPTSDRPAGDARRDASATDVATEARNDSNQPDDITTDVPAVDSGPGGGNKDALPVTDARAEHIDPSDGGADGSSGDAEAGSPPIDVSSDGIAIDVASDNQPPRDVPPDAGDACTPNACGGCQPLNGTPGAPCGACGRYVCSADMQSVTCDDPGHVTYTAISDGCGLTATGEIRCWSPGNDQSRVVIAGAKAIGDGALCAVLANGALRCWGPDDNIGFNLLNAISSASTDNNIHCSLSDAGGVRCWGPNVFGQVGDGTNNPLPTPPGADVLTDVKQVSAAWSYVCAVMNDTGVRCWGTPSAELGSPFIPASAPNLFVGVEQVATAQYHRCVVMTDGDVRCWGDNGYGQLGDGTITRQESPGVVVLNGAKGIGVGPQHSCALSTAGRVRCWGNFQSGQMGPSAQMASEILTGVTAISSDGNCALMNWGAVQCWAVSPQGGVTSPSPVAQICP